MQRTQLDNPDPAHRPAEHYLLRELRRLLQEDPSVLEFFDGAIGDGLWFWDVTRPEEEWLSPRFKELFGYRDDEVADSAVWWQENILPDDLPLVVENFERHCADPTHPYDQVVRYRHRDGSTVWVRCRGLAIRDATGRAVRLLGAHSDLTALKRREAELEESEERFRAAFEDGPVGTAILSVEGRFQRVNRRLCEMLRYPAAELVGRGLAEVTHPDDAKADLTELNRLFAGEIDRYRIDKRWIRKDATTMWGTSNKTLVHSATGECFALSMIEDTTAIHDAEESRRDLDAMKDLFLQVVVHDLRNPIAGIAGIADALLADVGRPTPPDDLRRLLGQIHDEAERMGRLVSTLLESERLAAGKVTAVRRPTDLAALVRRVAERTARDDHPLRLDTDPVVAAVDAALVERIVENLVGNACRHTPPGTPVQVCVAPHPAGALIAVDDRGPGVPDEDKAPIFERFRTGVGGGTGIGLWAVRRMAELHGGRAWVEDAAGPGGASFRVLIPTGPVEALQAPPLTS